MGAYERSEMIELGGRAALVVGAGRGIGRAIAVALSGAGARVAVAARTPSELEETAALCRDGVVVPFDVADWDAVSAGVDDAARALGGIDVLVNAAGIYGPIGPTASVDPVAWAKAIGVNLVGTFNVCRAVIPLMVERGGGRIILLAGGGATAPLPFFSAYAASKAGVVRLAETLAEELVPASIYVNAIAPGLVDTRLQDDVLAAGKLAGPLLGKIRGARERGEGAVSPDVAAELVVHLASDRAKGLTGKLVAAPHDPWRDWHAPFDEFNASPLYTIRRVDPHTIGPVSGELRSSP